MQDGRYFVVLVIALVGCFLPLPASATTRGVPLGGCQTVEATQYTVSYIYDPNQGGTCDMSPPKYANLGVLACVAPKFYDHPSITAGCGVCYEVYGPGGAQTVIIGDYGSSAGTTWTLIQKGAWTSIMGTVGAGAGNSPMTIRKVSCPSTYVSGDIKIKWQPSGANNYYFELHVDNHRVGVSSLEVQGSITPGGNKWYNMTRKAVSNWFVFQGGDIGMPVKVRVTSFYGDSLTTTVTGTDIPTAVAKGPIDMGGQFPIPKSFGGPTDCMLPLPPANIYLDALYSTTVVDGGGWRDWGSYSLTISYTSTVTPYQGTKCIAVTYNAWGAIQIGTGNPFVSTDYASIEFYMRTASGTWTGLQVWWNGVTNTGASASTTAVAGFTIGTKWKLISIPMSKFKSMPYAINVLEIGATTASPQMYIDKIQLVGPSSTGGHYFSNAVIFPAVIGHNISIPSGASHSASVPSVYDYL